MSCVAQDMGEVAVDFPFRVSPSEQDIIELELKPPCSMVLVGRSGTGKTTCAIYRMWARWVTFRHHSTQPFNQVSCQAYMAWSWHCNHLLASCSIWGDNVSTICRQYGRWMHAI